MAKPKIKINRSLCISCGLCASIAPKTFELDEKSISKLKPGPYDDIKTILEAAKGCPARAISVSD